MKKQETPRARRLRHLTLSAMLAALSFVILYLGTLLDVLTLTAVGLASLFMLVAVREMPCLFRLLVYFATVLLSFLLLPNPEAGVLYLLLGGAYPMLKFPFEHLRRPLPLLCKLLYINAVITLSELCSVLLFSLPPAAWYVLLLFYLIANPTFLLYDRVLDRLLIYYEVRLRPRLARYL